MDIIKIYYQSDVRDLEIKLEEIILNIGEIYNLLKKMLKIKWMSEKNEWNEAECHFESSWEELLCTINLNGSM